MKTSDKHRETVNCVAASTIFKGTKKDDTLPKFFPAQKKRVTSVGLWKATRSILNALLTDWNDSTFQSGSVGRFDLLQASDIPLMSPHHYPSSVSSLHLFILLATSGSALLIRGKQSSHPEEFHVLQSAPHFSSDRDPLRNVAQEVKGKRRER